MKNYLFIIFQNQLIQLGCYLLWISLNEVHLAGGWVWQPNLSMILYCVEQVSTSITKQYNAFAFMQQW